MPDASLIDNLPPLQRLALAYAPASSRGALTALLALDARLADIVRQAREPMLAQLRLAWWRSELAGSPSNPTTADPLLASLRAWPGAAAALSGLSDGWEAMTGPAPLAGSAFSTLADARGSAFAALAGSPNEVGVALRMGRSWALADIAAHLSDPRERETALALVRAQDWTRGSLPRTLRPLAVLHGLAARTDWQKHDKVAQTPLALLVAVRIGIVGR